MIEMAFQLLFPLFLGLSPLLSAYMNPEDKEDIFARKACPAFLIFENVAYPADMTIELPCYCKPEEVQSVVWYYQKHLRRNHSKALTDFNGTLVVNPAQVMHTMVLQRRFSIRLFSLVIYRAQESDSGHYICSTTSGQFFFAYDVDIQKVRRILLSPRSLIFNQSFPIGRGTDDHYIMFNSYKPWSICDRCGIQGEQIRAGLCYVQSAYVNIRYRYSALPVASCGSPAVPRSFQLDEAHTGASLEVRECWTPCPKESTQTSTQNSTLKFLGYEESEAGVPVYYQNHPVNTHVILTCPGAKPWQAVAWDHGRKQMFYRQFLEGLNKTMQVYIDAGNNLHFSPVLLRDKGSYFCWLEGKLAAEIKLGVYLPLGFQQQLSDPERDFVLKVVLISYAVLTSVFVPFLITWSLFKHFKTSQNTVN